MVSSTSKKAGRPIAVYHPRSGPPVVGLFKLSDGRWRASGPEKYTFSEPDEQLAIARFLGWKNGQGTPTITIPTASAPLDDRRAIQAAIKALGQPDERHQDIRGNIAPPDLHQQATTATRHTITVKIVGDRIEFHQNDPVQEAAFWAVVRREIVTRPQYVAKMTGIEQIGYLSDLKPPETLPTFEELETLWTGKANVLPEEKRKVLADWKRFVRDASITSLKDITPPTVLAYRSKVYGMDLSAKRQQHLFNRARRIISFAKSNAIAMDACTAALDAMGLLTPDDTTVSINPSPIEPKDFNALMKVAKGDDRAMLLLMLNAALHTQECLDLTWDNIKGNVLIAHRKKKGKFLRIATLWPETVAALAKVEKKGEHIFYAKQNGMPLKIAGAGRRFRILRKRAKVPHVEADQIRDGAATAAAAANCNDRLINLLLGHRNPGMRDIYAKRNPELVRPACDAVYAVYFT
jgi:integrase